MDLHHKKKLARSQIFSDSESLNLHAGEDETVFVGLMMGSNVVIVEDFYLEYTVVCACTQVGYCYNTGQLKKGKKHIIRQYYRSCVFLLH